MAGILLHRVLTASLDQIRLLQVGDPSRYERANLLITRSADINPIGSIDKDDLVRVLDLIYSACFHILV
jgi:hypothetical protein